MMNAPDPSPVLVHYSTTFRYGAPVLCQSEALTTPATNDPRYVTCGACLERMTDGQRETRRLQVERYQSWGGR